MKLYKIRCFMSGFFCLALVFRPESMLADVAVCHTFSSHDHTARYLWICSHLADPSGGPIQGCCKSCCWEHSGACLWVHVEAPCCRGFIYEQIGGVTVFAACTNLCSLCLISQENDSLCFLLVLELSQFRL